MTMTEMEGNNMTFQERIDSKDLTAIHPVFINDVRATASKNSLHEDEVFKLWKKYENDCYNFDQSPTFSEFLRWNNLQAVA